MPIDFPNNPIAGQTYSFNSTTWEYNGVAWDKLFVEISGGTGSSFFYQGITAPLDVAGTRWFNTDDGRLYTAIQDDSGLFWVDLGGGSIGPTGPTGPPGSIGTIGDYVISVDGLTGIVTLPAWTNTDAGYSNGIASGVTFAVGSSAIDVLEQLIYPYQPVSFTAFNINLSTTTFDLGLTSAAGSYNATWSTSGPGANWIGGSVQIANNTSSTLLRGGLNYNSSPAGVTHPSYRYTTPTTIQFGITGQQVSNNLVSRTQSYSWLHRIYYGKSASSSLTSISNLTTGSASRFTSSTTSLGSFTYPFIASVSAEYCYVIVPTSPGSPGSYSSWKDPNNLSLSPVSGTFTELNNHGVTISWTWYQVSNPTTSTYSVTAS